MASIARKPMLLRATEPPGAPRVNPAFTEALGLDAVELATRPLLEWVHPEDRTELEQALADGVGEVRARHQTKAGEWQSLVWRIQTDAERTVVLAQVDDAAAAVSLAEPPGRAKSSLAETLERMVHIVESKVDGCRSSILLVQEDGEHVSVGAGPSMPAEYNRAVQGLRIGPTVGSCGTAAFWNVPVIVENIYEDPLWADLREAAKIAGVSACWSVPVTGAAGDEVLGAMALYKDEPAAPGPHDMELLEIAARMVGLAVEHDRMQHQLLEATKAEAVGVLAGGIAHDFNNLMTAVMGNAELAAMSVPEGSPAATNLDRIVAASEAAADLCRQLLAYAGRGSSAKELLDCNALVENLGDLMRAALSKKAALSFELHDAPLGVFADQSHLRQVFMNLMTNASDAIGTDEGEIVVRTECVVLSAEKVHQMQTHPRLKPGAYARVRVSDTGEGMSPETRARIFDPFFTTKKAGHGLGLAAVMGIAKSHEGALSVESQPGVGTTFSVWLPLREWQPASDGEAAGAATSRARRILVADDEKAVRVVLVAMLETAGYQVVEAADGQEAVDLFRQDPEGFDGVLLDLNMPRLDGDEAFAQLQEIRPDVRVILNSGFTEAEMLDRFHGAGLAGVLHKPVSMKALLEKVERALEGA